VLIINPLKAINPIAPIKMDDINAKICPKNMMNKRINIAASKNLIF
jgi:hypothetical protein